MHGQMMVIPADPTSFYAVVNQPGETTYHILRAALFNIRGRTDWRWSHLGTVDYTTDSPSADATDWRNLIGSVWGAEDYHLLLLGLHGTATQPYRIADLREENNHVSISLPQAPDETATPFMRTTVMDAGFRNVQKRFSSVVIRSGKLSDTANKIQVVARLDGREWFFLSHNRSAAAAELTMDSASLRFPSESVGYILELEFRPYYSGSGPAPFIESFTVDGELRPEAKEMYPMLAMLTDQQEMLNEAVDYVPAGVKLKALRGWRDTAREVAVEIWDEPTEAIEIEAIVLPQSWEEERVSRNRTTDTMWMVGFTLVRVDKEVDTVTVTETSPGSGRTGTFWTFEDDDDDHWTVNPSGDHFIVA